MYDKTPFGEPKKPLRGKSFLSSEPEPGPLHRNQSRNNDNRSLKDRQFHNGAADGLPYAFPILHMEDGDDLPQLVHLGMWEEVFGGMACVFEGSDVDV